MPVFFLSSRSLSRMNHARPRFFIFLCLTAASCARPTPGVATAPSLYRLTREDDRIAFESSSLSAAVRKQGYVTGIEAGSLLDKRTGFRDLGFGLHIVDWLMEPGSDQAYRDQLEGDLPYDFGNLVHGNRPKRSIEGPQICTRAKVLTPEIFEGKEWIGVKQSFRYTLAAPGKKTGSVWRQTIVFPPGKRYFLSSDEVTVVNASDALFLRIDMPGHIKHNRGDTFSEIYLSYHGRIPSSEFAEDFPPDAKYLYSREEGKVPRRFIRAYRIRDPATGRDGPWLAGMTLDPSAVYEAWCHQRGYVCLIEEIGGRPVRPGDTFGAAYVVGFFDSIEEMEAVYDEHAGKTRID